MSTLILISQRIFNGRTLKMASFIESIHRKRAAMWCSQGHIFAPKKSCKKCTLETGTCRHVRWMHRQLSGWRHWCRNLPHSGVSSVTYQSVSWDRSEHVYRHARDQPTTVAASVYPSSNFDCFARSCCFISTVLLHNHWKVAADVELFSMKKW